MAFSSIPNDLWKEVQRCLQNCKDWVSFMDTSKCVFQKLKYETMEIFINALDTFPSKELPIILSKLVQVDQQVHLKINVYDLKTADYDWEFKDHKISSSTKLIAYVEWFLTCTSAKSLTWEGDTGLIDHIPDVYNMLSRFERLSIGGEGGLIDFSRLNNGNRLRVLRLKDDVEFVFFGCQTNLNELRELHVKRVGGLDTCLATSSNLDLLDSWKFGKSHPFAEYTFPGLQTASFTDCIGDLFFDPIKFRHVPELIFDGCDADVSCLTNNPDFPSSLSYRGDPYLVGSGQFDKMLAHPTPLKKLVVHFLIMNYQRLLKLADRSVRELSVFSYASNEIPFMPTLRSVHISADRSVGGSDLFSSCSNLHHLFSVEISFCSKLISLQGLERVTVVSIDNCPGIFSLEYRSISITACANLEDFGALKNIKKVSVCSCPRFTSCKDVVGVEDLSISDCEGLRSIERDDMRHCKSLSLARMDHLQSLADLKDIPVISLRNFSVNKRILCDLGGIHNQKMILSEVDIPADLPYLEKYLKVERKVKKFSVTSFFPFPRLILETILLKKL